MLEEKGIFHRDAASENNNLGREIAGLRAKVERLEEEVEFISKDRCAFVREICVFENMLGDFNSWPESRVEYDELVPEFKAMKRQRARERILQEQISNIAEEAKLELAVAKRAAAMSKVANGKERDETGEKYQTLLANSTTFTTAADTNAAVATIAVAAEENTLGEEAPREEITSLTLALRFQTSLLSKKCSELDRMQSLLKTRSNHSAAQLKAAASTILSLEEGKSHAEGRTEELGRDLREANEKVEDMERFYMAAAFGYEGEGENKEEEKENEEEKEKARGEESVERSWLLKQVVAMSNKKKRPSGAGSGVDEDGSDAGNEADDEDQDDDEEDEEDEE